MQELNIHTFFTSSSPAAARKLVEEGITTLEGKSTQYNVCCLESHNLL